MAQIKVSGNSSVWAGATQSLAGSLHKSGQRNVSASIHRARPPIAPLLSLITAETDMTTPPPIGTTPRARTCQIVLRR